MDLHSAAISPNPSSSCNAPALLRCFAIPTVQNPVTPGCGWPCRRPLVYRIGNYGNQPTHSLLDHTRLPASTMTVCENRSSRLMSSRWEGMPCWPPKSRATLDPTRGPTKGTSFFFASSGFSASQHSQEHPGRIKAWEDRLLTMSIQCWNPSSAKVGRAKYSLSPPCRHGSIAATRPEFTLSCNKPVTRRYLATHCHSTCYLPVQAIPSVSCQESGESP